jgi:ribonuclease BN (tRNA processing enzyme)
VITHEISPGLIYKDENLKVIAFPARHGTVKDAFGFRFETPTKTIVMSGDTAPAQSVEENCRDCDVLIHEAYSQHTFDRVSSQWQEYRRSYHTSSRELAAMARRVRPKLLVLYHRSNPGGGLALANPEDVLLDEIRRDYEGPVVIGRDLDMF